VRTPESMRVVRFDHFGGPDVLHVDVVPVPEPLTVPSQEQAAKRGARGLRYAAKESGEDLAQNGRLIDAGKVRPVIARTFELGEAPAAQQFLEQEHPAGKVTLLVH
jgi:NADPH:quinone reductase-like Zn-dependent oxidoreductase